MTTLLTDFMALLYPSICIGCEDVLQHHEEVICLSCSVDLPKTNFENQKNNPVERLFWFKTKIEEASSSYFFSKNSRIQNMIHSFKYKGNQEAAIFMGKQMGELIKCSDRFKGVTLIIPVPLHPIKFKKRGYNQAQKIAEGISETLGIPVLTESLFRKIPNQTQTKKSLFNRWKNVNSIFGIRNPQYIEKQHVLLVDDVITSGSTIEAAAQEILLCKETKVSIASLAVATG